MKDYARFERCSVLYSSKAEGSCAEEMWQEKKRYGMQPDFYMHHQLWVKYDFDRLL